MIMRDMFQMTKSFTIQFLPLGKKMTSDVSFEQKILSEFIQYLNKQGLSICNYIQTAQIYWPIDSQSCASNYLKERQGLGQN